MKNNVPIGRPGIMGLAKFLWHLPNFARLYWRLWKDSRVSWFARAVLVVAAIYIVSPLDFLPDYLPFLGELDDLAVVFLALRGFIKLCPKEVVAEHVAAIDVRTPRI
jgi:uncharacterized membrane protein YkvA (DUF1232 family)